MSVNWPSFGYFHSDAFTEDDWKLVQLVLTLFRNTLAVQEIPLHQKSGGSANQLLSLRDRFLELLFRENVMDIVLVIINYAGSSNAFLHQDNLLLLEILHYICMGQEPELIVRAHLDGLKVSFPTTDSMLFFGNYNFFIHPSGENHLYNMLKLFLPLCLCLSQYMGEVHRLLNF